MAALKHSAEQNSEDLAQVEAGAATEVSLSLVQRGGDGVVTVHSPARELQAHIDAAIRLDWRTAEAIDAPAETHFLAGMAIMSIIAIVGWAGLVQLALALI